ncbi:MAG TPA: D-alanine--D-alanine ligase [Candidatus Limnocylindrales bacterium]|nr:D-alanine--D-alanine ligase [Candidatus Limnocylindrales bacterium]
MTTQRIRVGVLAGGASSERAISLATGIEIATHLPADRFEVVLIDPLALMSRNPRLTEDQRVHARALAAHAGVMEELPERDRRELPAKLQSKILEAAAELQSATTALVQFEPGVGAGAGRPIDVAFIAIHGQWGEDGTIQGMLELLGIPYVGSGVLASALAMDKVMAKRMLAATGLEVPRGFEVERAHRDPDLEQQLADEIGYPLVAKPVQQGSSVGINLVDNADELRAALDSALQYDDRVLVEERIFGTELTVGVIGNRPNLEPLPVIEIVTRHEFFDYQAKYDPQLSDEICPARIPDELALRVQDMASRAHTALGCRDLSRTDMIATPDGRVVLLEVNTIPGMTANSLLPKAARTAGIEFGDLCARLIDLALARAQAD